MGQKERRRSSGLKMFLGDYLNLATNPAIMKVMAKHGKLGALTCFPSPHRLAGDSTIAFSDVVIKINKRNKMQERILLVTGKRMHQVVIFISQKNLTTVESAVYNIDPGSYKVKRRIELLVR